MGSHILWLHIDAAERYPKKHERNGPLPNGSVQTTPRGCKNRLTTELTWPQSSPLLARRRKDWLLPPHWRPRSYEGDATSNLGGGGWTAPRPAKDTEVGPNSQAFNNPKKIRTRPDWGSLLVMKVRLPSRRPNSWPPWNPSTHCLIKPFFGGEVFWGG